MTAKKREAPAGGPMMESRLVRLAAGALLAAHVALGAFSAFSMSQTYDEAVHLASGYAFWKSGEYRVDAVRNTPLPRLIAALALLPLNPEPRLQDPAYLQGGDFVYADHFLYGNRVPAERLLMSARLFLLLLMSPILGYAVFRWARSLGGDSGGLGALFLYAFSPALLANAPLATADFTATAFIFLAACSLARALRPDSRMAPGLFLAGLLLGLALASKHSAAVLLAIIPISCAIHANLSSRPISWKGAVQGGLLILSGAILAVALVYRPGQLPVWWHGMQETLSLAKGGGGRITYLLGEISGQGWWYYFPLVFLMKTPIPLLLLLALATSSRAVARLEPPARAEMLSFAAAPAALWMGAACLSRLQIGLRHILPVFPFCCVIAGAVIAHFWRPGGARRWAVGLLLLWYAAGALRIHPHYLAYFNEASGGPGEGYKRLADSNLDWGQELKSLGKLLAAEGGPPIYLSYSGTADPHLYGIRYVPVAFFCEFPRPGDEVEPFRAGSILFAISATNRVSLYYSDRNLMGWLDAYKPYKVLGHTLFVYDFTQQPEALGRIAQILARQGDRPRAVALARWLDESMPRAGRDSG